MSDTMWSEWRPGGYDADGRPVEVRVGTITTKDEDASTDTQIVLNQKVYLQTRHPGDEAGE